MWPGKCEYSLLMMSLVNHLLTFIFLLEILQFYHQLIAHRGSQQKAEEIQQQPHAWPLFPTSHSGCLNTLGQPLFEYVGTAAAGFHHNQVPAPQYHLGDEETEEERLDLAEEEDEVAPQGSGFV